MMICQSIAVIITFYVITNGVINKFVLHIDLLIRGLNRQLYLRLLRKENKCEEIISVLLLLTERCISLQRNTGYGLGYSDWIPSLACARQVHWVSCSVC